MRSDTSFMAQARREVTEVMNRWHEIKEQIAAPQTTQDWVLKEAWPQAVIEMVDKLVAAQIMMLRAVEEVEARPWWKRRRPNPYAR